MDTLIKNITKKIFLETKFSNINDIKLNVFNLSSNTLVLENLQLTEVTNTGTYFVDLTINEVGYFLLEFSSATISENKIKKVINVVEEDIIKTIKEDSSLSRKLQSNKAVVSEDNKTVQIFDDDGITVLHSFDISDDKLTRTPK